MTSLFEHDGLVLKAHNGVTVYPSDHVTSLIASVCNPESQILAYIEGTRANRTYTFSPTSSSLRFLRTRVPNHMFQLDTSNFTVRANVTLLPYPPVRILKNLDMDYAHVVEMWCIDIKHQIELYETLCGEKFTLMYNIQSGDIYYLKDRRNADTHLTIHIGTGISQYRCANCTIYYANLKCQCRTIRYCSPECQKVDWPNHKSNHYLELDTVD